MSEVYYTIILNKLKEGPSMTDPFNSYYNGKVLELDSMDNQNATESFQSHKLSDTYQDMIVTTAHEDVRDTRSRK